MEIKGTCIMHTSEYLQVIFAVKSNGMMALTSSNKEDKWIRNKVLIDDC